MTDKQIIIDSIDVSGCLSFDKNNGYNICCYDDTREDKIPFANFCQENPNCPYKNWKRKEQECEELKEQLERADEDIKMKCTRCAMTNQLDEQLDQLKAELEQYKKSKQASYEALQKKCNELELGIRKLKTENEELKEYIKHLHNLCGNETDKQYEYKQILTEIKEITEKQQSWNETNRKCCETEFEADIIAWNWSALKQILQKISEVIKDE